MTHYYQAMAARPLDIIYARSLFRPADFGGNRYPWEVTARLAERGHRVRVVTPRFGGPLPGATAVTFIHYAVSRRTPLETFLTNALFSRVAIERALQQRRSDVAVLGSYDVAFGLYVALARHSPPSVFVYHSRFHSEAVRRLAARDSAMRLLGRAASAFVRGVEDLTYRSAALLVTVSPFSRREVEARLGRADPRVRIVPTGVDTRTFAPGDRAAARATLGIDPDDLVLIAVGRLAPVKRYDVAIRALASLRRALPRARLLLVGGGPEEPRLRALREELGLAEAVRLEGFREGAELLLRYHAADAMLCTSEFENWSLSLLEGMACALPVFGVPNGGIPELLSLADPRLVLPESEPEVVARELACRLSDSEGLRDLGRRARSLVEREFDWALVTERLERCLREVAA